MNNFLASINQNAIKKKKPFYSHSETIVHTNWFLNFETVLWFHLSNFTYHVMKDVIDRG